MERMKRRQSARRARANARRGAATSIGSARAQQESFLRGGATRDALLDAGIRVFGRDGYHAATTKAIASEAGANQALISYYFGGKEGLYRAVVERIVDMVAARIGGVAAEMEAALSTEVAKSGARDAHLERIFELLDRFVDVLSSDESAAWAGIIVREQQEPSAVFEILYERLQGRLLARLAALVAHVRGRTAPTADDRLTVLTIIGQALIFRVARASALRFTGWAGLEPPQKARIKKILRRNVGALLAEAIHDA